MDSSNAAVLCYKPPTFFDATFRRLPLASFASRAFFRTRTNLLSSTRKRAIAWSASSQPVKAHLANCALQRARRFNIFPLRLSGSESW
jgi:hypothetical protein